MNDCYLKGNCPCQTGSCYGEPDEGCPVYRYFRDLIMKEDDVPLISLEGYALTHEEVMQALKEVEDELSETRKELGYTK